MDQIYSSCDVSAVLLDIQEIFSKLKLVWEKKSFMNRSHKTNENKRMMKVKKVVSRTFDEEEDEKFWISFNL